MNSIVRICRHLVLVIAALALLGAAEDALATTTTTVSVWGYVLAEQPSSPSYPPTHQENSSSTAESRAWNTVTRTGTGAYTVRFPHLSVAGGTVNVTAVPLPFDSDLRRMCKVLKWFPAFIVGDDEVVEVRCFDWAGSPADAAFSATFARPVGAERYGYVWADQPTASVYTPHATYQYNSTGAQNTIYRVRIGVYAVRLPGLQDLPFDRGIAKVTAYGSGSDDCKLDWIISGTEAQVVYVACYTAAGVATDTRFTMTFHAASGLLGTSPPAVAYLLADDQSAQPSAWSSSEPSLQYDPSPWHSVIVRRSNTGSYTVSIPWIITRSANAQVTAYGAGAARCVARPWQPEFYPNTYRAELVGVACFDSDGNSVDSAFALSFVGTT